jgi:RimJ/RimL family protein N-acetyltransferase
VKQPRLEHALLEGERVRLRPLAPSDVDAAFALVHGCREVTDWLIWDGPETREELVPWYSNWAVQLPGGDNYHLALVERATGSFCGSIGLRFAGHPGRGDLGYWIGKQHWGAGLGTEAVRLAGFLAFEQLAARLVYAQVFEGNLASERVLAKNGYVEDPVGRDLVEKGGAYRERRFYRLTRAAWRARESGCPPPRVEVRLAGRRA